MPMRRSDAGRGADPRLPGLVGVVLCGGASRRMGRDKAGLAFDGRSLLEHAVGVLEQVATPVLLACGGADRYADLGHPRALDRAPGLGPLAGLEAGLAQAVCAGAAPELVWVAALACDMPRARAEVFRALFQRARTRAADGCLLANAAGVEPLFAVYRGTCLAPVRAALDAGERKLISFHAGYGPLSIERLDESELGLELARLHPATNVNTPAEYQELGAS